MKKETTMKQAFNKTSLALIVSSVFSQAIPIAATAIGFSALNVAHAQEAVSTSSATYVVQLDKESATAPKMFNLTDTNRVVVDFAKSDVVKEPVEFKHPLITKITKRNIGDRTRIVFDLSQPVKYGYEKKGNSYSFVFEKSSAFVSTGLMSKSSSMSETEKNAIIAKVNNLNIDKATVKTVTTVTKKVESVRPVSGVEIEKINIKKEKGRVAKLTVDLSNPLATPQITKNGNSLVLDFKGATIPKDLQRRVNTKQLGTVTQTLDVSSQQDNGRIILEQSDKDNWNYSFYQMDKKFILEVKQAEATTETVTRYKGKPLTLNFQNMEVRAILQVIADFTGLNIMTSDAVTGAMTVRLKDVPWDQALDLILDAKGLQQVKQGNVVWIATNQEITDKNTAQLQLKEQKDKLEPLKLEFFQINHYKAEKLKEVLESGKENNGGAAQPPGGAKKTFLSDRGNVGVDERNNMLFIQDTEAKLEEIRSLIKRLDIPTRQVLIEAKIVIADESFGRELGARFGINAGKTVGSRGFGIGGNLIDSGTIAGGGSVTTPAQVNLPATGSNNVSPAAIGFTILNAVGGNAIGFELSALEQNQRGKVLSKPRVLTTDNKRALIEQGSEIPYITPGSANSPATVTFKKAVLSLGVTPQISPNGRIIMDLNIRKDSIGQYITVQGGGSIPSIDTKNIDTQVTVTNGQTVVLGGVYELENRNDLSKIPFFGDIPILGNLFKNTTKSENKGELLVFITPYVIEDEDLDGNVENVPEITLSKSTK